MNRRDNSDSNKPTAKGFHNALRNKQNSQVGSLSQDASNQPASSASLFDDKEVSQSSCYPAENQRSSPKRTTHRCNQTANGQNSANDGSDDEDCLRKSVLPVAKFNSYDENVPPKSGEEYLRRVQLEERKYPEVMVKEVSDKIRKEAGSFDLNLVNKDFYYLNDDRVPDADWVDRAIGEFSDLRLQIEQIRKKHEKLFEGKYPLYDKLGLVWWKETFESSDEQPLVRTVLGYPQEHVKNGIKFITRYLKESKKFSCGQGKWVFTLLACLEMPMQPEFYYNLRNLTCVCSYIRQKYPVECKEQIASLNLIIYLIGKYFDQYDLVDGYTLK